MVHGTRPIVNSSSTAAACLSQGPASFRSFHTSHPRKNGNRESIDGLTNPPVTHNAPYPAHGSTLRFPRKASVAQKISRKTSAVRAVSHIHKMGKYRAVGRNTQAQDAPIATPSPKVLLAMPWMGIIVRAAKAQFSVAIIRREMSLYIPQPLKIPATRYG